MLFRNLRLNLAVMMVVLLGVASHGRAADPSELPADATFIQIVLESSWVGVVIAVMSIWSVSVIIEHFWSIRRSTMVNEEEVTEVRELVERRQFKECIERVSKSKTMFGDVLTVGLRHGRHGFDAMQEAVEERAMAWRSRLFRRVEYLNIIGNISPLLGLLGTVLGMIESFGQMRSGAYGADNLAGGISLALVSTFLGLVVAIVSMLFFGICRNRVDSMTVAAHAAAVDILEYFRPAQLPMSPAAPGSAMAAAAQVSSAYGLGPISSGGAVAAAPPGTAPSGGPLRTGTSGLNPSGPVQLAEG